MTFFIGFTGTEKKCIKLIDDDICNRKIEFKSKSEIMKRNRNYREVDKKIRTILKCKDLTALRDLL